MIFDSYQILFGSLELCSQCVSSNNVQQVSWSLASRNSRAVPGREHFPTLSIISSYYNQCLCSVQIKHKDNKSGRGALVGDEMHPIGDEEGNSECKSAKAIRLLREYRHSNAQQHYTISQDATVWNCTYKYFVQSNRLSLTCLINSKMTDSSACPMFNLNKSTFTNTLDEALT